MSPKQRRRLEVLRYLAGPDALGYPMDQGAVWMCVCGRPNAAGEDACRRCGRMKRDVFTSFNEATVEKLPNRLEMTAVFAAVCVAGNVLYLIHKGFGGRVIASLAVILLHGAVIAAALLLKKHLSTLRWSGGREEETPELPEE